ncbi:M13 family metallopeptidase [Timonella senegalensis]|uniref:M13 family metallopeptidase n=1 Tax=Timonella senegalensis TaxID=1465825 RepID=UPI0028A9E1EB|nr:M13-type metalloendopeptidase [Timonella senegalensis]
MTLSSDSLRSGINLDALSSQVRPQDDLYRHVNGAWLDSYTIPDDRASDGAFRGLFDQAEEDVKAIITDLAAKPESELTGVEQKVGGLYASFMDTDTINELGASPLDEDFALIDGVTEPSARAKALGQLQRTGALGAFAFFVDNDAKDPDKYVAYAYQSGLGLPDESYYKEDKYAEVRDAYVAHVARTLVLAGRAENLDAATEQAQRLLALETKIAAHHWDVVRDRDSELTYNPMTFDDLAASAPGFDFGAWREGLGAPAGSFDTVVAREPDFFTGFAQLWTSEPVEDWNIWFTFHIISGRASLLTDAFVEENFDFYGRTLSGAKVVRERWKRGVSMVESALGEAVGEVYVARHFPPAHKEHMDRLVGNLIEAYRQSITQLDWMGENTKVKALAKLDSFTPKIGYPAKWKDYSGLEIDAKDLVGNSRRSSALETDRELNKIGKPIDRDEWYMTPQTVNAYYNPGMNEIVFPAAILQPPFFDPEAEDAANFGGIGAVIGHEIGHGFDDQGSKYDGNGKLEDWWTAEDRAEFEKRAGALIEQYNALNPLQLDEEHKVNGALTIGENIGDLGGLTIALKAYAIALGGSLANAPVIDGLSGAERVFLSWAQVWQTKMHDELMIQRLATDPHSPAEFRCNQIVSNVDEFYDTYNVVEGDAAYLPSEQRVRIW